MYTCLCSKPASLLLLLLLVRLLLAVLLET
jgi:hypothetical protein